MVQATGLRATRASTTVLAVEADDFNLCTESILWTGWAKLPGAIEGDAVSCAACSDVVLGTINGDAGGDGRNTWEESGAVDASLSLSPMDVAASVNVVVVGVTSGSGSVEAEEVFRW